MTGPLISVIIPIYNTELYLERCIDSVLHQTYESLEILLIDDGSTDRSCEICDEYVEKDPRVQVVHRPNGGLSDARNFGIDHAKGDLITFVDSDDYLINDAIACMYCAKRDTGAQISCCLIRTVTNNHSFVFHRSFASACRPIKAETYSCAMALKKMLQQKDISVSACAKLYDKTLFGSIRYPVGALYEDLGTTYKLMSKAKTVALSKKDGYCYYMRRQGSIQNTPFTSDKLIELQYAKEQKAFLDRQFPELKIATTDRLVGVCFHILFGMGDAAETFSKERNEIIEIIKENRRGMVFGHDISTKVRFGCLISYFGFGLTEKVYKLLDIRGRIIR